MRAAYILLGIYLILVGLQFFGLTFDGIGLVLALLAIAAGLLFILGDTGGWRRGRRR